MDAVIAVFVFLLLVAVVLSLVLRPEGGSGDVNTLEVRGKRIADLLSVGPDAVIVDGEVDMQRLANLSNQSFADLQALFDENAQFCIVMEDREGNVITVEKKTGIGSEGLIVSEGKRCGRILKCDEDGDGNVADIEECLPFPGYFADCNDNNPHITPTSSNPYCDCDWSDGYGDGRQEICSNNIDDDCDGKIDQGCSAVVSPPYLMSDPWITPLTPSFEVPSDEDLTCNAVVDDPNEEDYLFYRIVWYRTNPPAGEFYSMQKFLLPFRYRTYPETTIVDINEYYQKNGSAYTPNNPSFAEREGGHWGVASFDGRSEQVGLRDSILIEHERLAPNNNYREFTFSAWVKQESYNDSALPNPLPIRAIAQREQSWRVLSLDDTVRFEWWDEDALIWNEYDTGSPIPLNTWAHYALVVNRSNITQYINGIPYGELDLIGHARLDRPDIGSELRNRFWIGGCDTPYCDGYNPFNGSMDDAAFYRWALKEEQIQLMANNRHNVLSHTMTEPGNQWKCSATPIDGTGRFGQTRWSTPVTII